MNKYFLYDTQENLLFSYKSININDCENMLSQLLKIIIRNEKSGKEKKSLKQLKKNMYDFTIRTEEGLNISFGKFLFEDNSFSDNNFEELVKTIRKKVFEEKNPERYNRNNKLNNILANIRRNQSNKKR